MNKNGILRSRMRRHSLFFFFIIILFSSLSEARPPDLSPANTKAKAEEIMRSHATYKKLDALLVRRSLENYINNLDPTKTYFIEPDIHDWLEPSNELIQKILDEYDQSQFTTFEAIQNAMVTAIQRRRLLEKQIDLSNLPKHVKAEEFKDMKWATAPEELLTRLRRIKALQLETAAKLKDDVKEKSLQRIAKRQVKYEEEILNDQPDPKQKSILSNVLKAIAAALDAHTSYFTPIEATQFLINVQQRLFGIGAQLRDDLNGFTVIKIVEGGPAAANKELKVKDRIIAVNGEPVVGMDIADAVELIRGEEHTPVVLTVIREVGEEENKKEEKLDIKLNRGEVVLKESRYEASFESYGDGVIVYLKLYSFYQDPISSSTSDLSQEIQKMKDNHHVLGVILDLRYNSGGILSQAVGVTGLFITKGIVVSIKEENGQVQHLRDLDGKMTWDGPLIVLVNRASASASEIVTQTLKDYGRAIVVGDDHTFGKGSFQTFTLATTGSDSVNPQGEYKVTRGRYYTVSGKTPQLNGVESDIMVPGLLSEAEIGEKFTKFPLENDSISPNFDDDLSDIPILQREKIKILYKFNLQPRLHTYDKYMLQLKENSKERIAISKSYQAFIKELQGKNDNVEEEPAEELGEIDLQLQETYNIMRDLLYLQISDK